LDGLKIAKLLAAKVLPILKGMTDEGGLESLLSSDVERLTAALERITDTDVDWLVKKALSLCSEKRSAGWVQVVDANGQYQVEGIEYDPVLTVKLTVSALQWGMRGFFDAGRWKAWTPLAEWNTRTPEP
jgi:hypothetical protein